MKNNIKVKNSRSECRIKMMKERKEMQEADKTGTKNIRKVNNDRW